MASLNKFEKEMVEDALSEYAKTLTTEGQKRTLRSAYYRIFTNKTREEVNEILDDISRRSWTGS